MHRFKSLKIWQESMRLSVDIYRIVAHFPNDEKYGITSQIKRAAVSIPSNIAEGSSRASNKDFIRFLSISLGSAFELETQLSIAHELQLLEANGFEALIAKLEEIQKMIIGFQTKLNENILNDNEEEYFSNPLKSNL